MFKLSAYDPFAITVLIFAVLLVAINVLPSVELFGLGRRGSSDLSSRPWSVAEKYNLSRGIDRPTNDFNLRPSHAQAAADAVHHSQRACTVVRRRKAVLLDKDFAIVRQA